MAILKLFKSKELSDEELIKKYKESKDAALIGVLYQRYTHITFAVCMKYLKNEDDAKDAVMQIFEKLMDDLQKHNVEYFQAWFHTLIRNFCFMQLRAKKTKVEYNDEVGHHKNSAIIMETDEQLHREDRELLEKDLTLLEKAIENLKNEQKECVKLFFLQEKSYKEIEEETGYSFKEVKSHIQNGKRNLKILLERNA